LSDEPTFRGTNPFPELLLVVLTLSNLVPLAQAGMMALVVLAGVIGWSGLSFGGAGFSCGRAAADMAQPAVAVRLASDSRDSAPPVFSAPLRHEPVGRVSDLRFQVVAPRVDLA
jgi:hypothetical protein